MRAIKFQRNALRLALVVLAVCVIFPLISMRSSADNAKVPDTDVTRVFGATLYAPVREHYIFRGWYLDAAFNQKIDGITTSQTGNLFLYAKWEPE